MNFLDENTDNQEVEETGLIDEMAGEMDNESDVAPSTDVPEEPEPDPYANYVIDLVDNSGEPVEFAFQIKKYLLLKTKLKTNNVRNVLLEAAENYDYLKLCQVIQIFSVKSYKDDDIFDIIDRVKEKQILFYAFISELGEHGFFDKTTIKELKDNEGTPRLNVTEIVNQALPQMIGQMLRSNIAAGLSTSTNLKSNATKPT